VRPNFIAGVVRSFLRSDTPLMKFLHTAARYNRSMIALSRLPKAIVSRLWAAEE